MPDTQFFSRESATALGTEVKTALALSKLRLCASPFVPNAFTTKAELVAAEAAFDGYPAGGYPLAAWSGPLNDPAGGAIITSPLVNAAYGPAEEPPVTASISAGWVEDTSGDVRLIFTYDPVRPMLAEGDGWPIIAQMVYGRNLPTV